MRSASTIEGARRMLSDTLVTSERGKPIGPRTEGQHQYVDALRKSDLVFAIGPAGTGKTYLAVAAAVGAALGAMVDRRRIRSARAGSAHGEA